MGAWSITSVRGTDPDPSRVWLGTSSRAGVVVSGMRAVGGSATSLTDVGEPRRCG